MGTPPFCGYPDLICPSNRLTSRSTDSQPKEVASTDDGTVFVVTENGVEVYYGGNVGKKVADLQLKANIKCIAVHEKLVAVGGEVSISPRLEIPSSCLSLLRITKRQPRTRSSICILGTAHH